MSSHDEVPPESPEPGRTIAILAKQAAKNGNVIQFPLKSFQKKNHEDLRKQTRSTWLVKKVLPTQGLAAIYGPSGSGKSFLALDVCAAIALGRPWFGRKTVKSDILYCALEGGGGLANRCDAWAEHNDMESLPENFGFLDISFDLGKDASAVCDAAKGCGVVVIDTLNQSMPGMDENKSDDMGLFIASCKKIQEALNCLVIVVHHTGKSEDKGMRGHSSLYAAMDAVIQTTRSGDERAWAVTKSKEGEEMDGTPFVLEIVKLGIDEDGEAITSCVVYAPEHENTKRRQKIGPKSRDYLAAIDRWLAAHGVLNKGYGPPGTKYIHRNDAMEVCEPFTAATGRSAHSAINTALKNLELAGYIKIAEDWFWRV